LKGSSVESKVEITDVDLVEFVKKVYELSNPQGLGALHFQMGYLSDEDAKKIVEYGKGGVHMDYVHGRACKMNVFKEDDKLFIGTPWHDHTEGQLKSLLEHFNISYEPEGDHNPSCNCDECRAKIGKEPQDAMGDLMKTAGVVSGKCKLDGMLTALLAKTGEDPCAGCNYNRDECNGRPKSNTYL